MWIGKISFCLLLCQSITLMSSALNRTQPVTLCLFCDHRNCGNTPQAKHIFPDFFHFPWLFPDHCQIPWLFQVSGRPVNRTQSEHLYMAPESQKQPHHCWLPSNVAEVCRCRYIDAGTDVSSVCVYMSVMSQSRWVEWSGSPVPHRLSTDSKVLWPTVVQVCGTTNIADNADHRCWQLCEGLQRKTGRRTPSSENYWGWNQPTGK